MPLALARCAFFAAAVVILFLANLPDPPELPAQLTDKIQHMLAFSVLAGLARIGWPATAAWKILLLLAAFGALIEVLQAAAGLGRDASAADWLADIAAVVLTLVALSTASQLIRKAGQFFTSSSPAD